MGTAIVIVVATFVAVTFVALAVLVIAYRHELRTGGIVLLGGVDWTPSDAEIQRVIDAGSREVKDPDARPELTL